MPRFLGRPQHLEIDPRKERKPRLLRSMHVDVPEPLVIHLVSCRLDDAHLLPPHIGGPYDRTNQSPALQVTVQRVVRCEPRFSPRNRVRRGSAIRGCTLPLSFTTTSGPRRGKGGMAI